MSTAFSCCLCFVLSLACNDKPQVTYNISEQRNTQLSFLIHESCIALKSCSVEKNGSFRYLLPKLSNCFHVYSSHFKQTVRNQSFNDYRSFDDFSFTTWYKIKCHLPSFLDIFISWISVIWDNKHIPLCNK